MITCLLGGSLPALEVQTAALDIDGSIALTEVVCVAVYGVALKPGSDPGSFNAAMAPLSEECRVLWRNADGPGWLRPHLELIASGRAWSFPPDASDDSKKITLSYFCAAQSWLMEDRKLEPVRDHPLQLAEKAKRLAQMTDAEAIANAIAEAKRIEHAETAINAKAMEFYKLLNRSVADGQITLKAIPTDPETNAWLPLTRGDPPHRLIPIDYFRLPLVHDLRGNTLEFDNFSTEEKMFAGIFDRNERAKEAVLVKWADVQLSAQDANALLSMFAEHRKPQGATATTSAAIGRCERWLIEVMRSSPLRRPKSKDAFYREACGKFPGIGASTNVKPSRGFQKVWDAALDKVGCREAWERPGPTEGSPRRDRRTK